MYIQELRKNSKKRKELKKFLLGFEGRGIRGADSMAKKLNRDAFRDIDCLKCANCCKTMAPTFKKTEVNLIASHMGMSYNDYFDSYLKVDNEGDIVNKNTPCQHLGQDNMCSIYEIRPKDCSGFPHTHKRDFTEFIPETHIQNIDCCPATYYVVEKMFEKIAGSKNVSL